MATKERKKQPVRDQSVEDIAGEHEVNPETVRRWVRMGCPATAQGRGKPHLLSSAEVQAWKSENGITGEIGRPSDTPDSPDLERARLRKENALASKYELQVKRERAELVPVEEVRQWIGERVGAAKNKLIGLGAAVTPLLEGRDTAERQGIIDARVTEILNELSDGELVAS